MLKPHLEAQIRNSWVDPRKFKTARELDHAYAGAWGFAQAVQEILDYVAASIEDAESLTKKEKGETEDKLRSAMS